MNEIAKLTDSNERQQRRWYEMSNGEAKLPDLVIEFIDAVAVHPETEYIEPQLPTTWPATSQNHPESYSG